MLKTPSLLWDRETVFLAAPSEGYQICTEIRITVQFSIAILYRQACYLSQLRWFSVASMFSIFGDTSPLPHPFLPFSTKELPMAKGNMSPWLRSLLELIAPSWKQAITANSAGYVVSYRSVLPLYLQTILIGSYQVPLQ